MSSGGPVVVGWKEPSLCDLREMSTQSIRCSSADTPGISEKWIG